MVPSAPIAGEDPRKSPVVNAHFSLGDAGPEYSLRRVCCTSWPNIGQGVVARAFGCGALPLLIFELGAQASSAMVKSSNASRCFMSGAPGKLLTVQYPARCMEASNVKIVGTHIARVRACSHNAS